MAARELSTNGGPRESQACQGGGTGDAPWRSAALAAPRRIQAMTPLGRDSGYFTPPVTAAAAADSN